MFLLNWHKKKQPVFIALIFVFFISPDSTSAQSLQDIRNRVEQRRLARMQTEAPPQTIRFQRRVIERPFSPRRFRSMSDALVLDVLDGSVLKVQLANGKTEGVRILGADAPIIVTPETGQQCYSLEAKRLLSTLVKGERVILEREERYQRDSQRRLVRYVRHNGRDVGAWMLARGAAFHDKDHPHSRTERYFWLEVDAREERRGIWSGRCEYNRDEDVFFDVEQ